MGLTERVTEANRNSGVRETRQRTTRENPLRNGAVIGRAKRPLVSFIPLATGGGVGGFSALIRSSTVAHCLPRLVSRAPALEISVAAIRGKTGPVPNGAVLFGPFSWAYKKKDEEKRLTTGWQSANTGRYRHAPMITPGAALSSANRRRPSGRGPLPPRRGGVDPNIHAADTGKNDNQLTRRHKGKKLSAISCQLEAIGENQIQHPLLPIFPACGGNSFCRQLEAKGSGEIDYQIQPTSRPNSLPAARSF